MKRKFLSFFLVLVLGLGLVACEPSKLKEDQPNTKGPELTTNEEENAETTNGKENNPKTEKSEPIEIAKSQIGKKDLEGYSKLDSFDFDFSEEDKFIVDLYANVDIDQSGELILDDGQNWKIVASKGEENYLLLDEYIQLGKINIFSTTSDDNKLSIVAECSSTAGLVIFKFDYNPSKEAFEKTYLYNLDGNVNKLTNY